MWEVWSRRKPWSELSSNQDVFKAVRDEKRTLPSLEKKDDEEDVPDGYDDLMKRCCEYKANQRPLIDVVRDSLQDLSERAAEIDREKLVHLELTRQGSLARSKRLVNMIGGEKVETKSVESNDSQRRRHSTGSNLQGNNTASVQIEMGTLSSSSNNDDGSGFELDSKE